MRILIDIGHPAHVHYFRNLYFELAKSHHVTVTCKSVPIILKLLAHYRIPYINLGEKGSTISGKIRKQICFSIQLRRILKEKQIDLAIGVSASVVHAAKLIKAKSILFDDDDQAVQPFTAKFVSPFADTIVSPDALQYEKLRKAIYYPGYHELSYLHPKRFTPNPVILSIYGISRDDKYFILRFNAFKAHHDIREGGMDISQKRKLIKLLSQYGKVYITTEAKLEPEFETYKLPIAHWEMHDFLAYSQVLISDSQTMSSEAAVLGVPSFRCNSFAGRISYLEEEEKKYGLTHGFLPHQFPWMIKTIEKVLDKSIDKKDWLARRDAMLFDKIDVTNFWAWFINNYPESVKLSKAKDFNFDIFK